MSSPLKKLALTLTLLSVSNLILVKAIGQQPKQDHFKAVGNPFMGGFVTGNDFRQYSQPEKLAYVTGIYDGYMYAPALGAESANDQALHDCLPHLMSDQLLAIVEKYLKDHPEDWGSSMNGIVFQSLPKNCRDAIFANFSK